MQHCWNLPPENNRDGEQLKNKQTNKKSRTPAAVQSAKLTEMLLLDFLISLHTHGPTTLLSPESPVALIHFCPPSKLYCSYHRLTYGSVGASKAIALSQLGPFPHYLSHLRIPPPFHTFCCDIKCNHIQSTQTEVCLWQFPLAGVELCCPLMAPALSNVAADYGLEELRRLAGVSVCACMWVGGCGCGCGGFKQQRLSCFRPHMPFPIYCIPH